MQIKILESKLIKIGFVGFGSLGQLLGNGFNDHYEISYYDPAVDISGFKKYKDIGEVVINSDIILIATPASSFEQILEVLQTYDLDSKLVVDVLSAKSFALESYKEYLQEAQVLSLHPLFGPPSYSRFEPNMRIVCTKEQGNMATDFKCKLAEQYDFKIIDISAEEHDKHMAVHHAIPFLLAHALAKTDFNKDPGDLTIPSEEKLRKIVEIAGKESIDLYHTIMRSNPYAKDAVDNLIATLGKEYKQLWP